MVLDKLIASENQLHHFILDRVQNLQFIVIFYYTIIVIAMALL